MRGSRTHLTESLHYHHYWAVVNYQARLLADKWREKLNQGEVKSLLETFGRFGAGSETRAQQRVGILLRERAEIAPDQVARLAT